MVAVATNLPPRPPLVSGGQNRLDYRPGGGLVDSLARSMGHERQMLGRYSDADVDPNPARFVGHTAFHEVRSFWGDNVAHKRAFSQAIARTAVGYVGGLGGFALPLDVSNRVIDHARALSAVWGLCRWIPVKTREWLCPINAELSRATGSRFGGFQATWGLSETTMPAPTDGKIGRVTFVQNRCLLFTQVSRDVFDDAEAVSFWVQEAAYKEISATIENTVINGAMGTVGGGGVAGPAGLIGGPATVAVPKGSTGSGAIGAPNIDSMWEALPEANSYSAVWLCNKTTAGAIDALAVSGQWPELQYLRAGENGWNWATLKGRPIVWSEFCPPLGDPGDLILFDPTEFIFTYMPLTKENPSPLAWDIGIDHVALNGTTVDPLRKGMLALPEGAFESRLSGEQYFQTDVLACAFKIRTGFPEHLDQNRYGGADHRIGNADRVRTLCHHRTALRLRGRSCDRLRLSAAL